MTDQPPIAVLGGGSFGTAIANLLAENGQRVLHWMRDPDQAEAIRQTRENPRYLKGIKIDLGVEPVTDLAATLAASHLIFVALPSSALRQALQPVAHLLTGKLLVSTTKGIEAKSFMLMSQILEDIAPQARIGVLSGPNLAREVAEHALTASVVASEDEELCQRVQAALHGRTFRVYASADRFGVELGGALKNVYAIIAGMAAAMGMGEGVKVFQQLGISLKDSNGAIKSTGSLLQEVGDQIRDLDRAQQVAILQKLGIDPTMVGALTGDGWAGGRPRRGVRARGVRRAVR
jgi:glycerol-3-phosphate dehydrogenase (NAD(P)+)